MSVTCLVTCLPVASVSLTVMLFLAPPPWSAVPAASGGNLPATGCAWMTPPVPASSCSPFPGGSLPSSPAPHRRSGTHRSSPRCHHPCPRPRWLTPTHLQKKTGKVQRCRRVVQKKKNLNATIKPWDEVALTNLTLISTTVVFASLCHNCFHTWRQPAWCSKIMPLKPQQSCTDGQGHCRYTTIYIRICTGKW